jgi:hypothetical protein
MRLQVPIHLAEEFYTLGKTRRHELVRNFRSIASTNASAQQYMEELRALAISAELIEWFDVGSRRLMGEFDVYVDSMAFRDDLDFLEAARWYPKERDTKLKNLRQGYILYGISFTHAIVLLIASCVSSFSFSAKPPSLLAFVLEVSILLAPIASICSLLALWKIAKAKGLSIARYFWLFPCLCIATPVPLIMILYAKDNNILNEPVPSKHHDLLCRLRSMLADEFDAETTSQPSNSDVAMEPIDEVNAPDSSEAPDTSGFPPDGRNLERLFELFRSGAISEAEFKRLKDTYQD